MTTDRREPLYWCRPCDVYGCGRRCWMCGSADLTWSHLPQYQLPGTRGVLLAELAGRTFRQTG
jgi:hypothetical protein